jgi:hypothetical protein
MSKLTHETIQSWSGGKDFVVFDKILNQYWSKDGLFTPDKSKAEIFKGKLDNNSELNSLNNGCVAQLT